jgi:SAM-dependent methyltransferase
MSLHNILKLVDQYYSEKILSLGPTPKGVDWNSAESQQLRFEQLMKVCNTDIPFSIIDYGCGYGALFDYLLSKNLQFQYYGFDISLQMIKKAKKLYDKILNCKFYIDESDLSIVDYIVASGIFNLKLEASEENWKDYILTTLSRISSLSKKGFALNILTIYSDTEYMRPDLNYADPFFYMIGVINIF